MNYNSQRSISNTRPPAKSPPKNTVFVNQETDVPDVATDMFLHVGRNILLILNREKKLSELKLRKKSFFFPLCLLNKIKNYDS